MPTRQQLETALYSALRDELGDPLTNVYLAALEDMAVEQAHAILDMIRDGLFAKAKAELQHAMTVEELANEKAELAKAGAALAQERAQIVAMTKAAMMKMFLSIAIAAVTAIL